MAVSGPDERTELYRRLWSDYEIDINSVTHKGYLYRIYSIILLISVSN